MAEKASTYPRNFWFGVALVLLGAINIAAMRGHASFWAWLTPFCGALMALTALIPKRKGRGDA